MRLLPSASIAACIVCYLLVAHPACAQEGILSSQNTSQAAPNNRAQGADSTIDGNSSTNKEQHLKTHIIYDSTINKMILVRLPMDSTAVLDTLYTKSHKPDKPINFDYTRVRRRQRKDDPKAPMQPPNEEYIFRRPYIPLG